MRGRHRTRPFCASTRTRPAGLRTTQATRSARASLSRPELTGTGAAGLAAAILTDIEGTTTPIAFVRDVLFPYARARLPEVVAQGAADPGVARLLAEVRVAVPDRPVLDVLLGWMDADAKATPLKTLQGLIWAEGYEGGAITGRLYQDVAPALRRWHGAGRRLDVYSSGSAAAQRLLFGYSDAGDLTPLFDEFFDTAIGHKRDPDSYRRIAAAVGFAPEKILFLSDVEAELDAAAEAGLRVCQLVRPADGTTASTRHPSAADFAAVERLFQLG